MQSTLLPSELLSEIASRAAEFDATNTFCAADIAALQATGYLAAAVPQEFGGAGLNILELVTAQRQLAAAAPATALAVNMHHVWVQVAAMLAQADRSTAPLWLLQEAAAGEIFAFGVSEPGNDKVLFDSLSTATPNAAGYQISGTKIFTTLAPCWSRLGLHAKTPEGKVIFGFVRRQGVDPRSAEQASRGLQSGSVLHPDVWNPLGMRATHSYNTVLQEVPLLREDIVTEFEPLDFTNPLAGAIFSSFSLLTAGVYLGIADRALELASAAARQRQQRAEILPAAYESLLVSADLQQRAAVAGIESLCRQMLTQQQKPDHFIALGAAKLQAVETAREVVTAAIKITGARAFQADHELARLWRDVLAGVFHPTSFAALAQSVKTARGL